MKLLPAVQTENVEDVRQECEDHGQKNWQPLLGIMRVLYCTEYHLANKQQSESKHYKNFKAVEI